MTSPVSIPAYSPRSTPPVSTPGSTPCSSSASSVCPLAPKVIQKPAAADPVQMSSGIVTQKEWVIPPRPKPGRKPATDTPPTKRKAQNRAAQRAFRERRAARVNELEDAIKEIEAEHAVQMLESQKEIERLRQGHAELVKESNGWKAEMGRLSGQVQELTERAKGYQEEVERLRAREQKLEKEREKQRDVAAVLPERAVVQVASPPSEAEGADVGQGRSPPTVVPLPPRRSLRSRTRASMAATATTAAAAVALPVPGAGGCGKDSTGACPCMAASKSTCAPKPTCAPTPLPSQALWPDIYAPEVTLHPLPKRPTSPSSHPLDKRTRLNATIHATPSAADELETDFTALYALGHAPTSTPSSRSGIILADPCGFCSDGTPCVCAEMAMMEEQHEQDFTQGDMEIDVRPTHDTKLPPLLYEIDEPLPASRQALLHPPNGTRPAIVSRSSATGCASGGAPGSCALCQKDPLAMLFCQSVASQRAGGVGGGFGGGGNKSSSGDSCGKDVNPGLRLRADTTTMDTNTTTGDSSSSCSAPSSSKAHPPLAQPILPPSNGIYIPCSAAYQTLARHRAFEKASMDDFPGLVRPLVVSDTTQSGCPKVEVGSLRDVLKMLDRRFGKDVM